MRDFAQEEKHPIRTENSKALLRGTYIFRIDWANSRLKDTFKNNGDLGGKTLGGS